jgi:nitronate monooxygenase
MTRDSLRGALKLPVIAAPMLLVSGPELVIGTSLGGVVGSFPAANARTAEECEAWVRRIDGALAEARSRGSTGVGPYAMNIIVKRAGTERFEADIAVAARYKVPIIITSIGDPSETVARIHDYGGLVFHDVATMRHAERAIARGVDGLILIAAGAGGHTGSASPFGFITELRRCWDGIIILGGGISNGRSVLAAEIIGADFAYMGTRFAASRESLAAEAYKAFLVSQRMDDIITTDRVSGIPANFMRGSIEALGLDPNNLPERHAPFRPELPVGVKAWRDVWSAGHGVGAIDDLPPVSDLVDRLAREYHAARSAFSGAPAPENA